MIDKNFQNGTEPMDMYYDASAVFVWHLPNRVHILFNVHGTSAQPLSMMWCLLM